MTVDTLMFSSIQRFYHSINFFDFLAYVKNGAILSRFLLEKTGHMTPFMTEEKDKALGVYDKVFGNTYFISETFWNGQTKLTPCAYGPITIIFNQNIWKYCSFHLNKGTLTRKTSRPIGYKELYYTINVLKDELRLEVYFDTRKLPFEDYIENIFIDPFTYKGSTLYDFIKTNITDTFLSEITLPLPCASPRCALIAEALITAADIHLTTKREPTNIIKESTILLDYFNNLRSGPQRALCAWMNYFSFGTLRHWRIRA